MTFLVSRLLSATLLRGVESALTLEMPPFRRPQLGKLLIRSVLDRTLFVLGRAMSVAGPAGLLIWLLANVSVSDATLLEHFSDALQPLGLMLGMDGVILMAFILGLPANEIVLPIIVMAYTSSGILTDLDSLGSLRELLTANGWTLVTALCTMVFTLMHWPCSTTLLTIKKETGRLKWTLVSLLTPAVCGALLCILINLVSLVF